MNHSKKLPKIIILSSWAIYTILNFVYVLLNKEILFKGKMIDDKTITISIVTATIVTALLWLISVLLVRFFLNLIDKKNPNNQYFNFMFSIMVFVKSLSTILIKNPNYGMIVYIILCVLLSLLIIIMSSKIKSISFSNKKDLLKILIVILGIFLI